MHLEVLIGAVAKQLRAASPEIGEPGYELRGRHGRCLVKVYFWQLVNDAHGCSSFSRSPTEGILQPVFYPETSEKKEREFAESALAISKMTNDEQPP